MFCRQDCRAIWLWLWWVETWHDRLQRQLLTSDYTYETYNYNTEATTATAAVTDSATTDYYPYTDYYYYYTDSPSGGKYSWTGNKDYLRMTDWLSFGSGGGGSIQIPQLPILPPPSSLGAGSGSPFILPDFSPCPQVGDTNWVWVIIYTPGQNGNHPSVCVPHDYSTTTLVDSLLYRPLWDIDKIFQPPTTTKSYHNDIFWSLPGLLDPFLSPSLLFEPYLGWFRSGSVPIKDDSGKTKKMRTSSEKYELKLPVKFLCVLYSIIRTLNKAVISFLRSVQISNQKIERKSRRKINPKIRGKYTRRVFKSLRLLTI